MITGIYILRQLVMFCYQQEVRMRAPDIFITIPSIDGYTYNIKTYDVLNMVEYKKKLRVTYKEGSECKFFMTLLTAEEIHERIIALEEANFKYTFGE